MSAFAEPTFAWEPITPRGVAAFARASFTRLFFVQFVIALLAAGAMIWFLSDAFFPTIDDAVANLPDTGKFYSGHLLWSDDSPEVLAESRFLEINVDLQHSGKVRSPAQFQIEFGESSLSIFSLFGEAEISYPANFYFPFNRNDLIPLWGAWKSDILVLVAIATIFGLMLTWIILATLYFLPVWIVCFFVNRDLNLAASWKLSAAALMPGAALMTLSILLYDYGGFDLVQLIFTFGLHFVIGWIYLIVSPMFLNRVLPKDKKNPFTPAR